jgi:hypothetical protein
LLENTLRFLILGTADVGVFNILDNDREQMNFTVESHFLYWILNDFFWMFNQFSEVLI